ncbi:hypothetical protein GQR58_023929 [Nymphon striatum]|nr:hypothetical protein GQR58_023929 [Nymphon striatum]
MDMRLRFRDVEEIMFFGNGGANLHIHEIAQGFPEDNQAEFHHGPHGNIAKYTEECSLYYFSCSSCGIFHMFCTISCTAFVCRLCPSQRLDTGSSSYERTSILCCRYYANSLKSAERASRGETGGKVYEVSDQFQAPDPKAFFGVSENKAALLEYLCDNWVIGESVNPHQSIKLFLSGGFRDIHKSVLLTNGNESPVTELQSTHEEADTRLLLHSIYATQVEGVKRIVMYANDTDVIVLAVYYYKTKLKKLGLDEFWMKTQQDSYLPIHKIANTLDADLCRALPLIHSLSGRDITSYPFFIGKTTWLQKDKTVPLDYIASYAEAEDDYSLTKDVIDQASQLFMASNATDLKRLPSTEDAFLLHLERSAYACIIDKTAHIANPVIPEPTEYGWISEGDNMIPHQMRNPSWPADAAKATNCSCKKGCQRNCSCSNASRRCNIGCLCRGHPDTCKQARLQEELEQELENESSDEESSGSSEGELED